MASRAFNSSLRSSLRISLQSSTRRAGRRMMSSEAHSAPKSDKPWIIGSALFFGPLFAYLVSPTGRGLDASNSHGHESSHSHEPQEVPVVTMTDDEGTKAEVTASLATSEAADSPQSASADPPTIAEPEAEAESAPKEDSPKDSSIEMKDDEGTPTDVGDAVKQSVTSDSPKDAEKKD